MTSASLFGEIQTRVLWGQTCVSVHVYVGQLPQTHPYSLFATVQVLVDGAPVRIQLWDTAGQVSSIKAAVSSGPVGQGLFAGF